MNYKQLTTTILFLIFSINFAFGQYPPTKIDLSDNFNNIQRYNEHIKMANEYHYKAAKAKGRNALKITIATVLVGASIYVLANDDLGLDETLNSVVVGAGLGAGIGILASGFEDSSSNKEAELIELESAKKLLPTLTKNKIN